MHTLDNLNVMLISELKEIAEGLGVKNAKKLDKEELVYKILDQQATSGEKPTPKKSEQETERKMRPRKTGFALWVCAHTACARSVT